MPRPTKCLPVAACLFALLLAAPGLAAEAPVGLSAFATPLVAADGHALAGMEGSGFARPPDDESVDGTRFESVRYRPRLEAVRYRPRRSNGDAPPSRIRGVTQFHAGFLDPEGPADPGFVVGFRGGQQIDGVIELGVGIDWRNKSGSETAVLQQAVGPGGETIIVERQLSSYSSNLFPVNAYLQVSAPRELGIVPYFGVGGGYQALFLTARDFQTGAEFDGTYDGWGWQLWGGVALPLSGRSSLVGEAFLNEATLSRDLYDPFTGETLRETVSVDGIGGRFGISWGF